MLTVQLTAQHVSVARNLIVQRLGPPNRFPRLGQFGFQRADLIAQLARQAGGRASRGARDPNKRTDQKYAEHNPAQKCGNLLPLQQIVQ